MPYSEIEIQKLNTISNGAGNSIYNRIQELHSNARLNYTLRKGSEEKRKYTNQRIEELRNIIGKYEGDLAEIVQAAIMENYYYYDGIANDSSRIFLQSTISSYIFEEDIEGIRIDEDAEFEDFETLISHSPYDYTDVYEIIEGLALASEYNSFISIKEEEERDAEVKESIYEKHLPRKNKSLLLEGKRLNLTERLIIANTVLDFEGKIRKLNISDTDKYQLMSYILGNDVSNVRNVVNGTRPNKVREKELNSYLKNLMK